MTLFAELVATSDRVASLPGRNAKIAAIASLLSGLAHDEIALGVAYLSGETRQGRKGIGHATIRDAQPDRAADAPSLALRDVDATLDAVAQMSGRGSALARRDRLRALLESATTAEQAFITRLLLGELRQGALEGLMIEAVAAAAELPAAEVRRAAMVGGGVAAVATAALTRGRDALRDHAIALFHPLAPMLAQPADDIEDAMARIPAASIEWKLDGARVQVHRQDNEVRLYSRTGKEITAAAPEIVEAVRALQPRDLILDGEAIALREDGTPYPFQDTMRRF